MLFLQFFKREVGGGFIVAHIIIPSLRKLQELRLLRRFNILQFLFLGSPNVIFLSNGFFSEELFEFTTCLFSFLVITLNFTFSSVLL